MQQNNSNTQIEENKPIDDNNLLQIEQIIARQKEVEEEKRRLMEIPKWYKTVTKILWIACNILLLGLPFLFNHINKRIKLKITVKASLLFTMIFTAIVSLSAIFFIYSVENYLYSNAYDQLNDYFSESYFDPVNINTLKNNAMLFEDDVIIAANLREGGEIYQNMSGMADMRGFEVKNGLMYAARTRILEGKVYTLVLTREVHSEARFLRQLKTIAFFLVPLMQLLAFSLGTLASGGMLAPIRKMILKLKGINYKKLNTRLDPIDSQDELRELTDIINGMLASLEDSFNQQTAFVSNASHELKTPIAVVQGYSNLLARWGKEKPDILEEGITAIQKESENMKNLVEKLLFLTKLGNKYVLHFTVFDIGALTKELCEQMNIAKPNHTFEVLGADYLEVEADQELIKQVMRVLLDNATKYSPANTNILMGCWLKNGNVTLSVKDKGMGISPQDLPHIFDRFYRCDKARGRMEGSTGLGLSIAKQIVDLHGGEITVKSTLGAGTEFIVELPKNKDQLLYEN